MDTQPKPDRNATPTDAAARMLELAATTSEQLVADAQSKAESLVAVAKAQADAIEQASLNEARQAATELTRSKQEQAADLERERVATLAELTNTKTGLEAQVAELRELERVHRRQLRLLLTEQLSRLDTTLPEPFTGRGTEAGASREI